jgi:hypothetical protein
MDKPKVAVEDMPLDELTAKVEALGEEYVPGPKFNLPSFDTLEDVIKFAGGVERLIEMVRPRRFEVNPENLITHWDVHQLGEVYAGLTLILDDRSVKEIWDDEHKKWVLPPTIEVRREDLERTRSVCRKLLSRMSSQIEWGD